MLLKVALLCQLLTAALARGGYEESSDIGITCVCSTTHCLEHRMQWCNTTGVCFSQYLDRRDGSHPVVRGCIGSKTPLLCENRRPAVAPGGAWPLLVCCATNLCNRDVVPTTAPSSSRSVNEDMDDEFLRRLNNDINKDIGMSTEGSLKNTPQMFNDGDEKPIDPDSPDTVLRIQTSQKKSPRRTGSFPHIVSPVYISVLVLGVISLVVIGIVAAIVLKRNNRLYAEQYGALERHDRCFVKVPHEVARIDDVEQCFHSKPYIQYVCNNKT